ncbi:hypothetical protein GOP47_0012371 [Adiantum capillus-veneris]|uniref:Sulfurtransferase n=1 Tax=Adiantum capillus-veneris TaxID=13818 RepID=A0A9D4ZGF2_ADICA|nr:hypothetical protein GOP47_0012371 [Adiantum capillus-veneris]
MASVSNATTTHGASLARVLSSRVQLLLHNSSFSKIARSPVGLACKQLHVNLTITVVKAQPFTSISHSRPRLAFASLGQAGPVANFATEIAEKVGSQKEMDPVVSPEWLNSRLSESNIKVVDASWYMPSDNRNPYQEYKACHIPKALFFDVDGVVDPTSNLPHMLPTEDAFAAAVSALGIRNTDTIVVYDGKGIFSAARVWWMFRTFGHQNVFVLDGGLPGWRATGLSIEDNTPEELLAKIQEASQVVKKVYQGEQVLEPSFKAKLQPDFVWSVEQVKANINDTKRVLVDARSKARFDGVVPEPRKGIRGGHVPGSKCVPFNEVLKDGGTLLEKEELRSKFDKAGVSLTSPIVTSCGTGVTSCVLALALHRLGKNDVAVYDGSWTEWGGLQDTPIETSFV